MPAENLVKGVMAFAAAVGIVGCVIRTQHTIDAHVTVDIRYIEEQAEDVLDFIEGKSETLPGLEPAPAPQSWLRTVVDAISPIQPAYAQELKTSSPEISAIAKRLRERHDVIEAYKRGEVFGENNRGYIEIVEDEGLEGEKLNEVQRIKAAENADRKQLYSEIARLNQDTRVTVSQVERIYAMTRLERAKSGERFQLPPPGDDFEDVKAMDFCKQLGDACRPGAWVAIP